MPPMYRARLGRSAFRPRATSSVTRAATVGAMSKPGALAGSSAAAKPSRSAGANTSLALAGEKIVGIQPSAISAARATFFGPMAAR